MLKRLPTDPLHLLHCIHRLVELLKYNVKCTAHGLSRSRAVQAYFSKTNLEFPLGALLRYYGIAQLFVEKVSAPHDYCAGTTPLSISLASHGLHSSSGWRRNCGGSGSSCVRLLTIFGPYTTRTLVPSAYLRLLCQSNPGAGGAEVDLSWRRKMTRGKSWDILSL